MHEFVTWLSLEIWRKSPCGLEITRRDMWQKFAWSHDHCSPRQSPVAWLPFGNMVMPLLFGALVTQSWSSPLHLAILRREALPRSTVNPGSAKLLPCQASPKFHCCHHWLRSPPGCCFVKPCRRQREGRRGASLRRCCWLLGVRQRRRRALPAYTATWIEEKEN